MAEQLSRELLSSVIAGRLTESATAADIFDSRQLSKLLPLSVQFFLLNEGCGGSDDEKNRLCSAACELEAWTISSQECHAPATIDGATVAPIFLKQAVKSHLHFSPIRSWKVSHNNSPPGGLRIVHRLTPSARLEAQPCSAGEVEHNFPKCRVGTGVLQVSVRWLKKNHYPSMPLLCPCVRLEGDDWGEPTAAKVVYDGERDADGLADRLNKISLISPSTIATTAKEGRRVWKQSESSVAIVDGQKRQSCDATRRNLPAAIESRRELLGAKPIRLRRSSGSLLLNFEESALNGRLPSMTNGVDGFRLKMSIISNSRPHFPAPLNMPVRTRYFDATDGRTSHFYLATCDITQTGSKQIRIPCECTVQAVLFNPQGTVVKIFQVPVSLNGMSGNTRTFVRQRTLSATAAESTSPPPNVSVNNSGRAPCDAERVSSSSLPTTSYLETARQPPPASSLKSLIHLRVFSDHEAKIYLHGDMRMLLSSDPDRNEQPAGKPEVVIVEGHELERMGNP